MWNDTESPAVCVMSRRIVCENCGKEAMHPEDVANGWQRRFVQGKARKPAVHEVKIYTAGVLDTTESLPTLVCDNCGAPIPDGAPCVAITIWRDGGLMGQWEHEFMQLL